MLRWASTCYAAPWLGPPPPFKLRSSIYDVNDNHQNDLIVCVDRQLSLRTGSFSEQLVHETGSIFFLTVNTASNPPPRYLIVAP